MATHFSGQSLVGQSFQGEDLTDANFSGCDLRSANFSGATLTNADFSQAICGLSLPWRCLQIVLLLLCSITIGIMLIVAGTFSGTFLIQANIEKFTLLPGILCILSFSSIAIPLIMQGFTTRAFQTIMVTGTLAIVGITAGTLTVGATASADAAGGMTGALVLFIGNAVILSVAGLTGGQWLIFSCLGTTVAAAIAVCPDIYPVAVRGITHLPAGMYNKFGLIAIALIVLAGNLHVALRILARDTQFDLIHKVATSLSSIGGTCFRGADLTRAHFDHAQLTCANLHQATLKQTSLYQVRQIHTAQLSGTILQVPAVRELAVRRQPSQTSYRDLNLAGIDLTGANLAGIDFTSANLSQANFTQAVLTDANLTHAQAIGSCFYQTEITGACLESWNIDSTTQLEGAQADYIYLQQQQQERRPSSGQFLPGEFTKLFQEVINTIDLLFQGGIDWQALHAMLNRASAEQGTPLSLRSIENKDDGVVLVRVDAPPSVDKADLHQQLTGHYQTALRQIEASYRQQLQAKEEQIAIYREQQANLSAIAQSLASRPIPLPTLPDHHQKQVQLRFIHTDSATGTLQVTLQIACEGAPAFIDCTAQLPDPNVVIRRYQQWRIAYERYQNSLQSPCRISAPPIQVTNISHRELHNDLNQSAAALARSFNQWLQADTFRPLQEALLEHLNATDDIRIVLSSNYPQIVQLPWSTWQLLTKYEKAELTLSCHQYRRAMAAVQKESEQKIQRDRTANHPASTINILAIFGNGPDLALTDDCQLLQTLPNAQVTVLNQPTRQVLTTHLWEQPWDILFYAGHSYTSGSEGYIQLNARQTLSLRDLNYGLRRACQNGLQLAIFNACEGLGLTGHLSDLPLDHMVIMREPVPDQVATHFLKNLLQIFQTGESLPQAVRAAREQLQAIEDRFPCATWLPLLCQTPVSRPLTWKALTGERKAVVFTK